MNVTLYYNFFLNFSVIPLEHFLHFKIIQSGAVVVVMDW